MKFFLICIMCIMILILSGCRKNELVVYEDSLEDFYQTVEHGYDFSIIQYYEDDIINSVSVEKRIDRRSSIKSYTHIFRKHLNPFDESMFTIEETVYYFHNENQLITEEDQVYEVSTISFDEYLLLDALPYIKLSSTFLKEYTITENKHVILNAIVDSDSVSDLIDKDVQDVIQTSLVIKLEDDRLRFLQVTIQQTFTTIIITIEPYTSEANVLIPKVEN